MEPGKHKTDAERATSRETLQASYDGAKDGGADAWVVEGAIPTDTWIDEVLRPVVMGSEVAG